MVCEIFSHQITYGRSVKNLTLVNHNNEKYYRIETEKNEVYFSRSVVVAPGRTPMIPTYSEKAHPHRVFHLTRYLKALNQMNQEKPLQRIAVVRGSQSAVEIILHLRQNDQNTEFINIQRGYGFRLKDTIPFSEHVYFPEFVDYYFNASEGSKERLNKYLYFTNYASADKDVIHQLYVSMYEDKLQGKLPVRVLSCQEIMNYSED